MRTKSGVTLRLARGADGNLKAINHASGKAVNLPPLPIPSNANISTINCIVSPRDPSSIMVIAVNNLIELKLDAAGTTLSETARLALPTELQGVGAAQLAGGGDSIIAILIGLRVAITHDFKSFELVDLPFAASSVAVDGVGRVLIGAAKSPELLLLDAGVATGIRLSDAAATSPDFTAHIPRAIRAYAGGFALMTQDRNFLTLSPSGG